MRRREGWSKAKNVMCEKAVVTHVTWGGGYCVWGVLKQNHEVMFFVLFYERQCHLV